MKKVLIIHASAGDGHKRAAEALNNAFMSSSEKDIEVTLIDSLDYTNRFFSSCYRVGYIILVKYLPTLWGFVYYLLDNRFFFNLNSPLRRLINALNTKRLKQFLVNERFDLILATHFLGVEVISHLKKKGALLSTLIAVLTDFKPHYYWQSEKVDIYTVAAEYTKAELIKRGVDEGKIRVTGIPLRKGFGANLSKEEARKVSGLDPYKFTVLVMGGGFGVGPIEKTVLSLQKLNFDCQIVAVCGHNSKLAHRLNALKTGFAKSTYIFGFYKNIDDIMAASDIMVTKVGGITCAETLAEGLPVLTINPIPGQEMHNAGFLFENNIGFKLSRVDEVNGIVSVFFRSPGKLNEISQDIHKLARPNAASDIVRLVIGTIYGPRTTPNQTEFSGI
ncbi:MAG: glycosyltransferase [Candidatus Omnitrophota bacterium]